MVVLDDRLPAFRLPLELRFEAGTGGSASQLSSPRMTIALLAAECILSFASLSFSSRAGRT